MHDLEVATEASLKNVEQRLERHISFFRDANRTNRYWSFRFAVAPVALTSIATVSIGLSEKLALKSFIVVALITSGLATVIGAWEALFSNRKLWVVSGITLAELRQLESEISYAKTKTNGLPSQQHVDAFDSTLSSIIRKSEAGWQSIMGR